MCRAKVNVYSEMDKCELHVPTSKKEMMMSADVAEAQVSSHNLFDTYAWLATVIVFKMNAFNNTQIQLVFMCIGDS